MSRLKYTTKNAFFGYVANITTLMLGFASRTIFIHVLGTTYLGVNGLFTNVIGVLSFAELGIGTAMNYILYKPVAENNIEKIKSLMQFYKKAYKIIALIITLIGILLLPFLKYIINDPGNIGNIYIYYVIFLFNTVSSYFVSYKYSLVNAEQKNYIISYTNTIISIIRVITQIIVLLVFHNFLIYLLTATFVGLAKKIFISLYLNKKYPYLLENNVKKLKQEELKLIKRKVLALVFHKLGEISVYQSDNIVISAFISVQMVGIVSNYNLLIVYASNFIKIVFNSAIGSLGNLIATEEESRQYFIFKIYRFTAFWLYGFSSVAFFILLTPFIRLWLGSDMVISELTLLLITTNYYMLGHRICINNFKSAGGLFEPDKYVGLIQGVVNLIISIYMVRLIGLPGVYIGTIVQGTIATIIRPILTYKYIFKEKAISYFIDSFKFAGAVVLATAICWILKNNIISELSILNFLIMVVLVIIIPNLLFFIFFKNREEFTYIRKIVYNKFEFLNRE